MSERKKSPRTADLRRLRSDERRCGALNPHGRQCRGKPIGAYQYHGESELYQRIGGDDVTWVRVPVCAKHAEMLI